MAITGKTKIAAIIASITGLALVLSPAFSLLQAPTTNITPQDSFFADADFIQDDTVAEEVSDEDLAACGSLNESMQEILGVSQEIVDERKLASDKLLSEFCSRPTLIHEIMATDYASLSLVAYGCDAANGRIGTAALQDSLSDHKQIYCESSRQIIVSEAEAFLGTVKQFRTEFLPFYEASDQNKDIESINATLDQVSGLLEESISLVDSGHYYSAAKSFDQASKIFIGIFKDT